MNKWRFKEIVVMACLSVVFAVVYIAFLPPGQLLVGLFGPIGYEFIFGIWFLVSIIAAYIIRKPGAAFISETIAAMVELLIGNANGPIIIVSGMAQGIGAELVFASMRWHKYNTWIVMLAGAGSAVTSFIYDFFRLGYAVLGTEYWIAMLVLRIVSGTLIAGLLGKGISDGLAKTGVLSGFALGKVHRGKRGST